METRTRTSSQERQLFNPAQQDPLRKREEFAISLRKKKKQQIIEAKRQKLWTSKSKELISDEEIALLT